MTPSRLIPAALGALLAAPVLAQPNDVTVSGLHWRAVDQDFADRTPISISLRDTRVNLRADSNFEREYRLDGHPRFFGGAPSGGDYFMRRNGGLVAVYQHPSY